MVVKVAVVTGSNKGIGFGIVRGLCKQFQGDVFLTARDEGRGKQAIAELEKEGLKPKFHQLDISDPASRQRLAKFIGDNYGGIDILINNAGLAYKMNATDPFAEQAEMSVATNYYATLAMCELFMPLLKPGARVVNVSSSSGIFALNKCSKECASKMKASSTIEAVSECMDQFVSDTKAGVHQERGWANSAYGMSKIGQTLVTSILQQVLSQDGSRQDLVINACCPGYVKTDMTSQKGTKTLDEGADTPLYLALLPPNTDIKGQFVRDRGVVNIK